MKQVESPAAIGEILRNHGLPEHSFEFPQSTRSAIEAATAIGCDVAAIGKSLVFVGKNSQSPILVITSGAKRVDEEKLATLMNEPIRKAQADEVKKTTGYSIGGVPPFGHAQPIATFIDRSLMTFDTIWVAAGSPNSVFPIQPDKLKQIVQPKLVDDL
jgi:Cys-tRNA(Pro) deacylase